MELSSETTMRFGRQCMSDCAPIQKNSFPAESMRLSSAGVKCTELEGDYVEQ